MKKLLVFFICAFSVIGLAQQVAAATNTSDIYLHYYRYNGDYTDWNIWGWQSEPTSEKGSSYSFDADTTAAEFNYGGVVCIINIEDNFEDITEMGLIVRKGKWEEKDVATDRFITIPATTEDGDVHFYLVEGDSRIGESKDDPEGPDRYPKFISAYYTEMNTITFSTTEELDPNNVTVYADGSELTIDTISIDDNEGNIVLNEEVDFSKSYTIEAVFTSDGSTNDYDVTFDGIYDSDEFELAFGYEGELGAIISGNTTIFRLWAPVSASVSLNLYDTGTSLSDGGTDTPINTYEMVSGEKGTFEYTANENLHGTYYTYSVTNGDTTSEVIDPYAQSTGINGERGLVVDFDQVNPDGFEYNTRPDTMTNYTDAIIYELHVRDLTSSNTWNGSEENRGKYLGLIEEGTTYEGVTTGFDHILELGVTHVQLLPFFDYGVVDETRLDDEDYNSFNWGYMPLNFNALEGTYSANPYDGLVRIEEMKQVVTAFTEADLRINMDVVYNHTGLTADSNFNLIVPGYYYRLTDSGAYSNGSGTGNETASERYMMRKFMIDSTIFWATEYNISGFRFDLMSLHDIETMEQIAEELHEIDPTIMVYGEPWTGGTSTLDSSEMASKSNLSDIEGVAAFNDDTRDGIKGSVFQGAAGGYLQGVLSEEPEVRYGIVGGVEYPGFSYGEWHTEPVKTINYVACHDNNTLHDKLYLTLEESDELDYILPMAMQAYGIILTSQGIPFIHAGDEFLRSKADEDSWTGFDHNSYESPDSINQIDWSLKASEDGAQMNAYVKGLIELRKSHESFSMADSQDIIDNLTFLEEDYSGVIAFTLDNEASGDSAESILVVHNINKESIDLDLPDTGIWLLTVNEESAGTSVLDVYSNGGTLTVAANSTYVLILDSVDSNYEDVSGDVEGVNAYTFTEGTVGEDNYSSTLTIQNITDSNIDYTLPDIEGKWTLATDSITTYAAGETLTIPANTTYILEFGLDTGWSALAIVSTIIGGLTVVAGGIFVFLRFKK